MYTFERNYAYKQSNFEIRSMEFLFFFKNGPLPCIANGMRG